MNYYQIKKKLQCELDKTNVARTNIEWIERLVNLSILLDNHIEPKVTGDGKLFQTIIPQKSTEIKFDAELVDAIKKQQIERFSR